jgi:hypothetical protein
MSRTGIVSAAVFALALLSGCAGSGGDLVNGASSGAQLAGDENGGKIPNTLGSQADKTAAYQNVTTHCEKFGKKGIITKMDYDTGLVTFECRLLKGKTTG